MCLGTLVAQRLCSEGTKRFIRDCFVLRGHTETYQRFTVLRGHWYIIALREHSGISAGIPFGQPQVVVDWERVIQKLSFLSPVGTTNSVDRRKLGLHITLSQSTTAWGQPNGIPADIPEHSLSTIIYQCPLSTIFESPGSLDTWVNTLHTH